MEALASGREKLPEDACRLFVFAADQRRLSRVAEGTGPTKPQQPGSNAPVLLPAQHGRDKILG
jgi:hypothetical protein